MTRYVYISHSALSHHGIRGMKWGKRNGPPYPLDPSDHSAAEKKANNGRYSQGVKQDRSGKKSMTDEERAEKIRKIKKGIAIGAGVAGAAALTAGAVYAAKHPEATKAALRGVKDLAVNAASGMKDRLAANKLGSRESRKIAKSMIKNATRQNKSFIKSDIKQDIKSSLAKDKDNNLLSKWDRQYKRQEKKGILSGDVIKNKDKLNDAILDRPERLFKNKSSIIKEHGQKAYDDLASSVARRDSSDKVASKHYGNYKSNKGIKGVAKKVWAPVAGVATVAGTVGSTVGKINGAINTVGSAMNNQYVKKAYNAYMNDPYDQKYYNNQDQDKKKQGGYK